MSYSTKIEFFEQNIFGEYGHVEPHVWGFDEPETSIDLALDDKSIDGIVRKAIEHEEFPDNIPVLVLVSVLEGGREGEPIVMEGWCLNSLHIVTDGAECDQQHEPGRENVKEKKRGCRPRVIWSESTYNLDRVSLRRFKGLTDLG